MHPSTTVTADLALASSPVGTLPHSPVSRLTRTLLALAVSILTMLSIAGVNATPASAATWFNQGSNGLVYTYPTAFGQYVTKVRYGALTTMSGVRVPGLVLGRSPATSGVQLVTYNIAVEQWYGDRWVQVQTDGTGVWKVQLTGTQTQMSTYYIQLGAPGYYRVNLGINWYDANNRLLGGRGYYLNASGDYGCSIAACQVGPGWIKL